MAQRRTSQVTAQTLTVCAHRWIKWPLIDVTFAHFKSMICA